MGAEKSNNAKIFIVFRLNTNRIHLIYFNLYIVFHNGYKIIAMPVLLRLMKICGSRFFIQFSKGSYVIWHVISLRIMLFKILFYQLLVRNWFVYFYYYFSIIIIYSIFILFEKNKRIFSSK